MSPRTLRRVSLAALALAAVALAPEEAHATPRAPSEAVADEAANARFTEGIRLYKKRRYEEARAAFLQSIALRRRPETTFMLAQSALRTGRWLDALRGFDQFKTEVNGEIPAKLGELFEAGRREAARHVAHLTFDVPPDADVVLDGDRLPSAKDGVDVMPGPHIVVVTSHGEKKVETVDVAGGTTVTVKPVFIPKALVPAPEPRARPAAREPERDRGAEGASPGLLTPPQTTWPIYVAGAIGLGGLAVGAIFGGLQANSHHAIDVSQQTLARAGYSNATCGSSSRFDKDPNDAATFQETCLTLAKNTELARDQGAVMVPAIAVGAAGLGVALAWFFFAPKQGAVPKDTRSAKPAAKPTPPGLAPWLGPATAGATLVGRF